MKLKIAITMLICAAVAIAILVVSCNISKNNIIVETSEHATTETVEKHTDNTQKSSTAGTTDPGKIQPTSPKEPVTAAALKVNGKEFPAGSTVIDVKGQTISDLATFIKELQQFKSLTHVFCNGSSLTAQQMVTLRDAMPTIIFGYDAPLAGQVFDSMMTEIDISGKPVTELDTFVSELTAFTSLEKIDMCGCGLSNEQMELLQNNFPKTKFVWEINLVYWKLRTDAVAFSTLKDGSINYRLNNEDVKPLKYCTDLVALDLGHHMITDYSFLEHLTKLKILILVDNRVYEPDGTFQRKFASDISVIKNLTNLEYLEFFHSSVSDLSFLQYLPKLRDLNISDSPISDITYLLNLPNIERLFFERTNISQADYEKLKATYPNAQLAYTGDGSGIDQGWRTHERYTIMMDMFRKNYVHDYYKDK